LGNLLRKTDSFVMTVSPADTERDNVNIFVTHEEIQGQPSVASEKDEKILFEPLFSDPYELSYTCLLIPRFASHYLMGDIADNLRPWMQRVCISFGWTLDFLIIKPDFLEWAMQVPPTTSPAYCIQVFRRHLSVHIFEEHPRFKKENLSKDFWAPGHIILVGSRPLPDEIIQRFVQAARIRQEGRAGRKTP